MMAELDILNGFAGKVISDCIDITVNAIKKADKNRKTGNQTIEARIYQVIIDALNVFPYNKYKKEEKVYEAAESILKELKKGNADYKESVRLGLNMLSSEITGDICGDFLKLLCDEIRRKENRDLAIGYIIHQGERISEQQLQMDRHMQEEFGESHQNEKAILTEVGCVKSLIEEKNEEKDFKTGNKSIIVNRADEYAQRWNKNVFLNDFNEEDENAETEIKLSEIYIEECLPHYIWGTNKNSKDKLRNLLTRHIYEFNNEKMLLILGQPGIGKSTLITWIMANFAEKKDKFLVYQFASDLGDVNWQGNHILREILNALNLDSDDLENKMLILDGFDEICINRDRERVLNILYQELKQTFWMKNFIIIITCRENYLDCRQLSTKEYIILQAWDEDQIESFCKIYGTVNKKDISQNTIQKIKENKAVFGIPLILYMILALNVNIEKSSSIVDIYDQIFSLKRGGIYDRCYDVEHRINEPKVKKHIHRISQRMAFWIFENNANKATISQEEFEEICKNEMRKLGENGEGIQGDTLIGNFFKLNHCEGKGTDELQFVHRSIYEYFVVVHFYESIYKLKSKEDIAGKLGELLKDGQLSEQILVFIKYKFDSMKGYNLPDIIKNIFNIMLRDGMTYHAEERYRNVIEREKNIFLNMLKIMNLWNQVLGQLDDRIIIYLQCNIEEGLNLEGIKLGVKGSGPRSLYEAYLNGADLNRIYLRGANLKETDLVGVYLNGADLRGVNLVGADLTRAHLNRTDLEEANMSGATLDLVDLRKANLSGADLREAHLDGANLSEANLTRTIFDVNQIKQIQKKSYDLNQCKVFLSKTKKIISYKEYCIRKQKNEI